MMTTFAERRDDALARLDSLRRWRGATVLDGEPLDDNEIIAVEQEIDALAQAEVESMRRQRDEETDRLSGIAAVPLDDLADKEHERLTAICQAEKGARRKAARW